MSNKLAFADLIERFGEVEAVRTLEAIEAIVHYQEALDRLGLGMECRLRSAMERLNDINFAV